MDTTNGMAMSRSVSELLYYWDALTVCTTNGMAISMSVSELLYYCDVLTVCTTCIRPSAAFYERLSDPEQVKLQLSSRSRRGYSGNSKGIRNRRDWHKSHKDRTRQRVHSR